MFKSIKTQSFAVSVATLIKYGTKYSRVDQVKFVEDIL